MATYCISFRIADRMVRGLGYSERYGNLTTRIKTLTYNKYWEETSSYFVTQSDYSIDDLTEELEHAIAPEYDVVLVTMPEVKSARIVGAYTDNDIFELIPYLKKH